MSSPGKPYGMLLSGWESDIESLYQKWNDQPVDLNIEANSQQWTADPYSTSDTTLENDFSVEGPGTFFGKARRTLHFAPTAKKGWWFNRTDLPGQMPIGVSVHNVWTTARNIVLCSGSPHNYMRMVEHIVALRIGMGLDNVMISMDSGDPPLFDRSSLDLVEGVEKAGVVTQDSPATFVTVKKPVSIVSQTGSFLTFLPAENSSRELVLDCAVDFKSAIGKQRIIFPVNNKTFRHGAGARTNCTLGMMIYCRTIGKIFADVRHLGYTTKNIQIAGPRKYFNEPGLLHEGKSIEAAWHRATLDLLAAIALIDKGRLVGKVISYRSGHGLDVDMIRALYQRDMLCRLPA